MRKNTIKLLLTTLLAFTIALPVASVNALSAPNLNLNNRPILADEVLETQEFNDNKKQYLINEYGENYEEQFGKNSRSVETAKKILSLFPTNKAGEASYPTFMGSLYINNEDNLVIQLIKSAIPYAGTTEYSIYKNVLTVDDSAIIEYVKHPHAELEAANSAISALFTQNKLPNSVEAFYIDDINNIVVVELSYFTEEEIAKFKNTALDLPFITFKKRKQKATFDANINAGGILGANKCSVAYRAKKSGASSKGFVTAGHCVSLNQTISNFGTVKNRNLSGNMDAAWVDSANTTGNPTNSWHTYIPYATPAGSLSTSVETLFFTGQRIGKLGMTTKYKTGSILNVSYSSTIQGIKLTNQVNTNVSSLPGDSGGIYFTNVLGINYTAGIHSHSNGSGGVFTKASIVNSAFGLYRY